LGAEGSVLLNAHDWRSDPVECAWNQSQVRSGLECNGYWEIEVPIAGRYRFELRRWPREEDRAIVAGMPGEVVPYYRLRDSYGGGRAIHLTRARIRVADCEQSGPIASGDKAVVFTVDLNAGETRLQTWLSDEGGTSIGAYYVYVDQVSVTEPR
jgi:hypothetical protein